MKHPEKNRQGYKQTKIGSIPREWRVEPFAAVVDRSQYGLSVASSDGGKVPILGMKDIADGFVTFEELPCVNVSAAEASKYCVKNGDLLFNRTNSLEHVGKTGLVRSDREAVFASYLVRFQLKAWQAMPAFVAYAFNTTDARNRLRRLATPGVCQHNINQSELQKHFYLPLPPLPEQRKIAEILSTWDEAIGQTRNLIDAKKRRKRGLMQQLLTGEKRLPGFNEEWRPVPIGKLFETVSRPLDWEDEMVYSLLSIRRRSGGVFLRERLRGSAIKTKVMFEAKAGDFLISKMQVLHGATGLVPEELGGMHISGSYIALRPRHEAPIEPRFFSRLSSTPEFYHLTYVSSYGVHIEKMTFNLRWFLKAEVTVPTSVEEQTAIARRLDLIDEDITHQEAELKALEKQKRGLMQKLLTGAVRVKV